MLGAASRPGPGEHVRSSLLQAPLSFSFPLSLARAILSQRCLARAVRALSTALCMLLPRCRGTVRAVLPAGATADSPHSCPGTRSCVRSWPQPLVLLLACVLALPDPPAGVQGRDGGLGGGGLGWAPWCSSPLGASCHPCHELTGLCLGAGGKPWCAGGWGGQELPGQAGHPLPVLVGRQSDPPHHHQPSARGESCRWTAPLPAPSLAPAGMMARLRSAPGSSPPSLPKPGLDTWVPFWHRGRRKPPAPFGTPWPGKAFRGPFREAPAPAL